MKREPIYLARSDGSAQTGYNVAMADWFNRPEILEIDLSGWTVDKGRVIRVRPQDDVKVQRVKVVISDENGTLLEEGLASGKYNTTQATTDNMRVTETAMDLPGHVTERSEVKHISS